MGRSNKKRSTGDVEIIEMSAGDYIKAGLSGLDPNRFDEDEIDALYSTTLELYREVRNIGYSPERRHLCASCLAMAGRKKNLFISIKEVVDAFDLETGKVQSITHKVKKKLDDKYDLNQPPVSQYFKYYLEEAERLGYIDGIAKDEFGKKFYQCVKKLDEDEKIEFHHDIHAFSSSSNRVLAGGFLKFIKKYFMEESHFTDQEINDISGITATTIRKISNGLADIEKLEEIDNYGEIKESDKKSDMRYEKKEQEVIDKIKLYSNRLDFNKTEETIKLVRKTDLPDKNNIQAIAASYIYFTGCAVGDKFTQPEISNATEESESMIRKCNKIIANQVGENPSMGGSSKAKEFIQNLSDKDNSENDNSPY